MEYRTESTFRLSRAERCSRPIIRPNVGYNAVKDFTPISIMAVSVAAIAVNASLPVTSLKELVAYAKAHPGKLSYGSAGAGTMANLAAVIAHDCRGGEVIVEESAHIYNSEGGGLSAIAGAVARPASR